MRTPAPYLIVLLVLLVMLALAGCATTQAPAPKPGIQVVYRDVKVPVAVACVDRAKIPDEPARIAGKLTGDARRDLDTVGANAIRLRAWGVELSALVLACAKP